MEGDRAQRNGWCQESATNVFSVGNLSLSRTMLAVFIWVATRKVVY